VSSDERWDFMILFLITTEWIIFRKPDSRASINKQKLLFAIALAKISRE
jgi:hypothetical protein